MSQSAQLLKISKLLLIAAEAVLCGSEQSFPITTNNLSGTQYSISVSETKSFANETLFQVNTFKI